jgi:extradiol dioxygenase family protein
MKKSLFHLAIPAFDLKKTMKFYEKLGCKFGRASENAVIMNFFGDQVVLQRVDIMPDDQKSIYPRHFGRIFLSFSKWEKIFKHAKKGKLEFYQKERKRFPGEFTEHHTFFLQDPSRNILEFKFYANQQAIFGGKNIRVVGDR